MITPERYGLNATKTLAHVSPRKPTPGDQLFWSQLRQRFHVLEHRFESVSDPALFGDSAVTHALRSADERLIGCAIRGEIDAPRAAIVHLHGYSPGPIDPGRPVLVEGTVDIQARVRGFPGSLRCDEELAALPTGWITYKIEDVDQWSVTGGVLDAAGFILAARRRWPSIPVFLKGESFGGGLAVLATALLQHDAPDRLVIGLPSLGDWRWRLRHDSHGGSGEEVAHHVLRNRLHEKSIVRSLLMLDAAIHATRIITPTFCKLATCDEVVPAPTAASVFNALGTDAGLKARYVTPFGHFDGGLANARRHAEFEREAALFLNPEVAPIESLWQISRRPGERRD